MVNNATNINKPNNHLSHLTIEHKNGPNHSALEMQVQEWDRSKTLPEHLSSFSAVTRSLVLCVDRCLSFGPFSFGHYVVCPASIYVF